MTFVNLASFRFFSLDQMVLSFGKNALEAIVIFPHPRATHSLFAEGLLIPGRLLAYPSGDAGAPSLYSKTLLEGR